LGSNDVVYASVDDWLFASLWCLVLLQSDSCWLVLLQLHLLDEATQLVD